MNFNDSEAESNGKSDGLNLPSPSTSAKNSAIAGSGGAGSGGAELGGAGSGIDPMTLTGNSSFFENEPWSFGRGGFVGDIQRLLPLDSAFDLFAIKPPHPPVDQIAFVRPFNFNSGGDKNSIYELCRRTFDDGLDVSERFSAFPDLPGDW